MLYVGRNAADSDCELIWMDQHDPESHDMPMVGLPEHFRRAFDD
jgi:hypothetical protein